MDGLVKTGLIVGGAYLVSKYVFGFDPLASMFGVATTGSGTPVNTGGGTSTTPQAVNPQAASTMAALIKQLQASGVDPTSYQTFDTWNFYYQKTRGIAGPDPGTFLTSSTRSELMSLDQWWGYMTSAGFSGMGLIAHAVNPYHNYQGTPFGANVVPNGMEKYIKNF
jgi:hypothetical protein